MLHARLSGIPIDLGEGKFANYNKILGAPLPNSGLLDFAIDSREGGIATKLNSNVTRLIHVFGKQDPAAGIHCRPVANRRKAGKLRETMLELRRIRGARASLIPEFINYTVHAEDIYYVGYKLQLRLPYKRNGGRASLPPLSLSLSIYPSIYLSLPGERRFTGQARMEIKKDGSLSAAVSLLLNKLLPADKE